MEHRVRQPRPPIVLIIDDQEWSTRSLESILAPNGFAVMRAYTGKKGLERAAIHIPDAVFVDISLPDCDGLDVCRTLRDDPLIGRETPIIVTSPERPSRSQRLDALRAGAWDVFGYPLDAEEVVLRLDAYAQAKFATERSRDEGLLDPLTGLYNLRGLERRADELASWAYRERRALACVVFAAAVPDEEDEAGMIGELKSLASAFRSSGRISDTIGRLGKTEIAVLAPSTDAAGALKLAERLADAIRHAGPVPGAVDLRAGFDAVANVRESPVDAKDLLKRATIALRKSKANGNEWIQPFETREP